MLLANAAQIARDALRAVNGLSATINRGNATCDAIAIMGRTESVSTSDQTVRVEADAQDILISAACYTPAGSVVEPVDGDRITVEFPDLSIVLYDVRTPSNSTGCFQYSDALKTELRVHCKRVTV